jgi:hypothetical protein
MTNLPPAVDDEEWMITVAGEAYAVFQRNMSADYTRGWLKMMLQDFLRKGLIETLQLIEAADRGNEIAHEALVSVHAEMQNPPAQLKAYVERAAIQRTKSRKRGRKGYDNLLRNLGLCVLIYWVAKRFNLNPTRELESCVVPWSGASVLAVAMRRRGAKTSEKRLNNIWSEGWGATVLNFVATRPMSIPN